MVGRITIFLILLSGAALAESPYAGQEAREIKSLSSSEIEGYLDGRGMGFAKVAELNGYPGPKHVLELADKLDLTELQIERTQALFDEMKKDASFLGEQLVAEERRLDNLFEHREIDTESLDVIVGKIGELKAAIRRTHLEAHLLQREMLDDGQVRRYVHLRGYHGQHHGAHD